MWKVAVLGWYGHGNFGDELILEGLRELFKDWLLYPFSSDAKGYYPQINFNDVNECDLFVLGGGELVNKNFVWMPYPCSLKVGSKLYRLYAHTPFARRSWVKLITVPKVILGCGVDVSVSEELCKNVVHDLEQFQYIGLRDQTAVTILQSFPSLKDRVHLFHDLALAINTEPEVLEYLVKIYPFKLHGMILSYLLGQSLSPVNFYHRKVGRVYSTISGLSIDDVKAQQKFQFSALVEALGK